jgi:Na+-transporting methylmalonyl-CoA/oxaloacetate decarboxylase gamma subunit
MVFGQALLNADWLEISSQTFSWSAIAPLLGTFFLQNGIGLVLLLMVTLVTFLAWKRSRFFGTAAPLLTGALLVVLALRLHFAGFTFLFVALPFLILFMAGVSADLLQSRYAVLANAVIVGVLIANAMIDIYSLMYLTSRSR